MVIEVVPGSLDGPRPGTSTGIIGMQQALFNREMRLLAASGAK
jgi:hypothetical protein